MYMYVIIINAIINPSHSIRVIPTPAARELIIPLIKKNQWRIQKQQPHSVGKRGKEEEVGVTSHEDNEAAKEILKGI